MSNHVMNGDGSCMKYISECYGYALMIWYGACFGKERWFMCGRTRRSSLMGGGCISEGCAKSQGESGKCTIQERLANRDR